MHFVLFLLFGLLVGLVSRAIVPGRAPGGWFPAIALGIAGAFLGGFLGRALGLYGAAQPAGFLISIVGAVVVLFGYQVVLSFRASV